METIFMNNQYQRLVIIIILPASDFAEILYKRNLKLNRARVYGFPFDTDPLKWMWRQCTVVRLTSGQCPRRKMTSVYQCKAMDLRNSALETTTIEPSWFRLLHCTSFVEIYDYNLLSKVIMFHCNWYWIHVCNIYEKGINTFVNVKADSEFILFHDLDTELDLHRLWVVSMEHLQRVWYASRERLPFRTPGSVPHCGTCLCSNCWDQIPRTCNVFTRLFTSNTPWYFLDFA